MPSKSDKPVKCPLLHRRRALELFVEIYFDDATPAALLATAARGEVNRLMVDKRLSLDDAMEQVVWRLVTDFSEIVLTDLRNHANDPNGTTLHDALAETAERLSAEEAAIAHQPRSAEAIGANGELLRQPGALALFARHFEVPVESMMVDAVQTEINRLLQPEEESEARRAAEEAEEAAGMLAGTVLLRLATEGPGVIPALLCGKWASEADIVQALKNTRLLMALGEVGGEGDGSKLN